MRRGWGGPLSKNRTTAQAADVQNATGTDISWVRTFGNSGSPWRKDADSRQRTPTRVELLRQAVCGTHPTGLPRGTHTPALPCQSGAYGIELACRGLVVPTVPARPPAGWLAAAGNAAESPE